MNARVLSNGHSIPARIGRREVGCVGIDRHFRHNTCKGCSRRLYGGDYEIILISSELYDRLDEQIPGAADPSGLVSSADGLAYAGAGVPSG